MALQVDLQSREKLFMKIQVAGDNMFLPAPYISKDYSSSEIVINNYRAAAIFRKYGIGYCCGAFSSLEEICRQKDLPLDSLLQELETATRSVNLPAGIPFEEWSIDFLIDYIVNIHHYYLRNLIPSLEPALNKFVEEHERKYEGLNELSILFNKLASDIIPHLQEEEEVLFPYLRFLANARKNNEPYGALLVKTLRKPVDKMMEHDHTMIETILQGLRRVTNNYVLPAKPCASHRVVWATLKELDTDLCQHIYLENRILFPKSLAIEKELLNQPQ